MHPSRGSAVAFVVALTLLAPAHAEADDGHRSPAAREQLLAHLSHGAAAVSALGDRLPQAAALNGMTAERLASVLQSDPTAWLGEDGQMFYVEEAEALGSEEVAAGGVAGAATATYPESQTFALHSLPGSNHTIFLDFDGASVSGTWWNAHKGMPARFYTGFTLDADPSAFTSAEKAYIQSVWRIVAEKYSPFDVDVTTQDPGAGGYNRSGLADPTYGDHVIVTDDTDAVSTACGGTCSGIALLDTFDDPYDSTGYDEPAWVFSSMTWDSPVLTAHTVAHEVGHTFGLNHDGVAGVADYYEGQGNWFPIMGSSARAVGQWSQGEYDGASNTEDDLAEIAAHGAPLRADDHGDTRPSATALTTGSVADGVIGTRADNDVFAIAHNCTTNLTARATGVGAGATLDLSLTVTDGAGTVLGSADPASGQALSWPVFLPTGMEAQVTVPAGVGTYYVRIDGVGKGNPATTGYSDYASVGDYVLAISGCDGTMPDVTTPTLPTTTTTTTTTTSTLGAGAPSSPGIRRATPGRRGGAITATARWDAPASTGGAAIVGYKVQAERIGSSGRVVKVLVSPMFSPGARTASLRLRKGHYRFRVVAYNSTGFSPLSAMSQVVTAR